MCRKCEMRVVLHKWRAWRDQIAEGSWVVWELEQAAGRKNFTRAEAREWWAKMSERARKIARETWDAKGRNWGSALRELAKEDELKAQVERGKAHMCSIGLGAFVGATPTSSLSPWGAVPEEVKVEWGGEPAEETENDNNGQPAQVGGEEMMV